MRSGSKITAGLVVAALSLTLTACGGDSGAGDSDRFTYWSMYKEDEPRAKVIKDAAAAFTAETGIKVDVVFQGREVLNKLQPTLVGGNAAADLVDQSLVKLRDTLGQTGNARDLAGVYKAKVPGEDKTVADVVPDAYEKLSRQDDSAYVVPTTVQTWQVFYNKKALPDLAKNPPRTPDELVKLLDARKADGRKPLALDGDILPYVEKWTSNLMVGALGPGNWKKVLEDKSGAGFDRPEVLRAAKNAERIAKGGYFTDGWDASKFPAIQQKWAQGKADLLFMGTWAPSETGEVAGEDFAYGSFPFPAGAEANRSDEVSLYGYGIPSKARNGAAAEKFIAFILGKKWMDRIAAEEGAITVREDVAAPPALADAYEVLKDSPSVHLQNDGAQGMSDWEIKVSQPLAKKLLSGDISAREYVSGLKSDTVNWWKVNG
ncbi:carbohydrate ABC transporter substrate-binding protein [Streptomyces sp. NA04227]|uniref:ABC transporter substrate-binding protein n=1 Tax=Streptomyces sp. NA04227 TaxID=2742136 RepID=UPI00159132C3|nr:ABC transporter substrate-binding protein [Streptomyces sp. NA04227]QKW07616.1 carbohydrate ABC transporter substrate-binding protein [Streptomyces sp. NA04227]